MEWKIAPVERASRIVAVRIHERRAGQHARPGHPATVRMDDLGAVAPQPCGGNKKKAARRLPFFSSEVAYHHMP
jgi:hypothetical protein